MRFMSASSFGLTVRQNGTANEPTRSVPLILPRIMIRELKNALREGNNGRATGSSTGARRFAASSLFLRQRET
jgi:hypothetical protein